MMEMRTKLRRGIVRRKCSQISKTSIKIARRESLKKISTILRKNESSRSAEEKAVLAKMTEEVREVKYRLCRKQKIIERNKEVEDDLSVLKVKCKKLATALQRAKHLVVYTGAGISTSADIPDYRGPNGIWTLLQQGKKIGKHDLTKADPTSTHMALWQLYRKKYLKFVVSQNCDGLHLRSGLPRRALSEVHGNMYVEMCRECKPNVQYWRLFDTTERTARFNHKTGRICHICGSPLVDSIVHFGERGIAQWPLNWAGALHHAAKADVILCLGSSLKVLKKYPWLWAMDKPVKKRPAIYIVNLQWTPKDHVAELKINGKCDSVMKLVMQYIGLEIPIYDRNDDPIFYHASLMSPKELHTTTQPFLIKTLKNDKDIKCEVIESETSENTEQAVELKAMEVDEDEDDCPLKILKEKMINSIEIIQEVPIDLTVPKMEKDFEQKVKIADQNECIASDIKQENTVDYEHVEQIRSDRHKNVDKIESSSVKVNCTLDIEEKTIKKSSSNAKDFQSNLKINAVISNTLKSESESDTKDNISHKTVEGISMEILAEEFERVHVEMKTNENEIHKVSILLVNKTKSTPQKCDKFQQTDPEPIGLDLTQYNGYCRDSQLLPPDPNHIDTGQVIQGIEKIHKIEQQTKVNVHSHVNLEKKNISSHIYINTNHISAELNTNSVKISTTDSHNVLNLSCETKTLNKDKITNPLRSFRRIKQVQKTFLKQEDITIHNQDVKTEVEETVLDMLLNTEGPIDCSLKTNGPQSSHIRIPHSFPENKVNHSYILKIPKPPVACFRKLPVLNVGVNGALDLSVNGKLANRFNSRHGHFRKAMNEVHKNVKSLEKKIVDDYENLQRQCEILASVIIQNTLQVNHRELQRAYSGLHSIINPIPFNVQYDFKTVFNALNFINFGQKLMSKENVNNTTLKRSPRILSKNANVKSNSSTTSSSTTSRRRYGGHARFSKKREPNCNFCYENYKSIMCNFYTPHNSDDRFVRYENDKPFMCACCGDSETSSESDDDISLMERKRRLEGKVSDESEDSKVLGDSKCNNDLKDGVQNVDKDDCGDNKDESVQAGWFGKGFRKNRRRKR